MARKTTSVEQGIRAFAEKLFGKSLVDFEYPDVVYSNEVKEAEEEIIPKDESFSPYSYKKRVLSEYLSEDDVIMIYENNAGQSDELKKQALIRRGIARACFDAIYHHIAHRAYHNRLKEGEIVRESLAEYFAYAFAMDKEIAESYGYNYEVASDLAKARHTFWEMHQDQGISFVHALFMEEHAYNEEGLAEGNAPLLKFLEVVEVSKHDMYAAYCLLTPEDKRRIKPRKTYKESDYVVIYTDPADSHWMMYLLEHGDRREIRRGDKVTLHGIFGTPYIEYVRNVKVMDELEYKTLCKKMLTKGLKVARR